MLKLDVTADVAKATEHLSDLAEKHIPNAAAKALTRTAFDARDAVRDGLPERFNPRRPWISRGIGVTPAQPRTLMAEVWARDRFMALQESGGTKTGKLAIPVSQHAACRPTRCAIPIGHSLKETAHARSTSFHRRQQTDYPAVSLTPLGGCRQTTCRPA
jgi:hypothetical protein